MTIAVTTTECANGSPITVWDRLWRHEPSDARDDALLARERRSARFAAIRQRVIQQFGSVRDLRTIELGCGRGDVSVLFAQEGADVTLLDASDRALLAAERRFHRLGLKAICRQADMLALPSTMHGAFDLAVSLGVAEHFRGDDRTKAIAAHDYVVREGGLVVISVPNARCVPYRLWKAYLELRGWWPYGMEIPYTARELRRRSIAVGLRDVDLRAFEFWRSVSEHWIKRVFGRGPDWSDVPSGLDHRFGEALVFMATRQCGNELTMTRRRLV